MQHSLLKKIFTVTLLLICASTIVDANQAETSTQQQSTSDKLKNDMDVVFGEKSASQQTAAVEYAQWTTALQEHLVAAGDSFALAITLASRLSAVKTAKLMAQVQDKEAMTQQLNNLSYQPIADALNVLIAQPDLTPESMDILTAICFDEAIQDFCHANVLLEKRMQLDQDNLQVYLRPFDAASQANKKLTIAKLLTLMANSKHSNSVLFITPELNQMIDEYILNNPIPQSYIDSLVSDYEKLSSISPSTKKQLVQLMPAFMPTYVKAVMRYLNDLPPYKTLLDYCKAHFAVANQCRDIAQIMIQKSNSLVDKGIGHAILIASYEAEGDQAGIKAASELNDQFKAGYQCIQKLANGPYPTDNAFDPVYQKISLEAKDEYEMMIQQAAHRYQKLKANGDESAVNPNQCFEVKNVQSDHN